MNANKAAVPARVRSRPRRPVLGVGVAIASPTRGWRVAGGIVGRAMKKTSIYLDPAVDRALVRRATAEGTTKAALIRAALAAAAAPTKRVKPWGSGVFKGPGDLSENVDEYLAKTGFGED